MGLFALEHSKTAYGADFAVNASAVVVLAGALVWGVQPAQAPQMAGLVLLGAAAWTVIEYALHRFVLHGVQPFQRWHAAHHERPAALIYAPTVLVTALMAALVFLPLLLLGGVWRACAVTLGVQAGYLAYAATHHASHQGRAHGGWLQRRQRQHALHHRRGAARPVCYGVTSGVWDRVFGSAAAGADARP